METKKVYRCLPDAKKYEIAFDGEIRFVSNKRRVVVDKNGNAAIFNDGGDRITVNKTSLLKDVWQKKSPPVKQKTDGKFLKSPADSKTADKKDSAAADKKDEAADEPKETATAKKPVAPTKATPASNGTIEKIKKLTCKKYQRIYLFHVNGVDKKEIEGLAGANAGEVSRAIRLDGEKAKTAEALLA